MNVLRRLACGAALATGLAVALQLSLGSAGREPLIAGSRLPPGPSPHAIPSARPDRVLLVRRVSVPDGMWPVVAISGEGEITTLVAGGWPAAGPAAIALPAADLESIGARARAALCAVLASWRGGVDRGPDWIIGVDVRADRSVVAGLLRWSR